MSNLSQRKGNEEASRRSLGETGWGVGACRILLSQIRSGRAPYSKSFGRRLNAIIVAALVSFSLLAGVAGTAEPVKSDAPATASNASTPAKQASDYGIEITSLRTSANGHMIDFRYKVLDPNKAATLAKRENKPYLIDQATGRRFTVPSTPKVGPMRQTAQKLTAGKIYFALFANPGKVIQPGNKVTIVIGDFRAENQTVN